MKLTLALLSFTSAAAFTTPHPAFRPATVLAMSTEARPDASKAIQDALAASKKYGPSSPEARVAWDIVEEIDAGDNSAAYETPSLEANCLTGEELDQACMEYADKMQQLQDYVGTVQPKVMELKAMAEKLGNIKLSVAKSKPAPDSPQVRDALKFAREQAKKYGESSPEARVAWTELEEIASSGLSNALGGNLEDDCVLDSAMEACRALEELHRVMDERNKSA